MWLGTARQVSKAGLNVVLISCCAALRRGLRAIMPRPSLTSLKDRADVGPDRTKFTQSRDFVIALEQRACLCLHTCKSFSCFLLWEMFF